MGIMSVLAVLLVTFAHWGILDKQIMTLFFIKHKSLIIINAATSVVLFARH